MDFKFRTISQTGARPVFVDIERDTHSIDASKIEERSLKTKVNYSRPFTWTIMIDPIISILKNNIKLIEDVAQSHLTEYKTK